MKIPTDINQKIEIPDNIKFNSNGVFGLYDDKVRLTKNSRACNDIILIEIVEQEIMRGMRGGIWIPEDNTLNEQLIKGRVFSIGPKVKNKGLNIGDYVLYDRLSAFYNPPIKPGILISTKFENVIVKIEEN